MDQGLTISNTWFKYTPDKTPPYTQYASKDIPSVSKGGTFTRDSAKAVYTPGVDGNNATFKFYYDHEVHNEGTEFSVPLSSNKGGMSPASSTKIFPDWYEVHTYLNNKESDLASLMSGSLEALLGNDIDIKIKLLLPTQDCDVTFDPSFIGCENLKDVHYWFVADSYGNAPFISYSGFKNFPTDELIDISEMFGGCSTEAMLCRVIPAYKYKIAQVGDTSFLTNSDTYNTRLTTLDLSGCELPF